MTWLEDARRLEIGQVLGQLFPGGANKAERRGRPGPCPACSGPDVQVWTTKEGWQRWTCYRCEGRGDAVDAVAFALCSEPFRGQDEVRAWVTGESSSIGKATPAKQPGYPPLVEVLDLLRACHAMGLAEAWLAARAQVLSLQGCMGTLNKTAKLPDWARIAGKTWHQSGHYVVIPMCDAAGNIRSVRARRNHNPDSPYPKAVSPAGYSTRGLLMASRWARAQLKAQDLGEAWRGTVMLVEGEPAWLRACSTWQPQGVLVLGFVAGSCTEETRAAIAAAATVIVAVDDDEPGRKYAEAWGFGRDVVVTFDKDECEKWTKLVRG